MKIWFSENAFFILCFTRRAFIMVKYIIKLVLEFQFDLQNPLKQPKMWFFEKWKILHSFWPKLWHFLAQRWSKTMYNNVFRWHKQYIFGFSHFWKLFFSNPPKIALFGLNWEESKWAWHFCSKVLNFFTWKIGVELPPGKKVPLHQR